MITLDFETQAIDGNPVMYPPKPIGLAIQQDDQPAQYITTWETMERVWKEVLSSHHELLFHNAPFDLSVGCAWLGGDWPIWTRVHDTMYSIFLDNPYARSLSLKPSADRILGLPPDEQDELHDWIIANVQGATPRNAGAFIERAPLDLVEKYAIGDVERTYQIHRKLIQRVPAIPYNRERKLMPILVRSTRHGIRLNRNRLEQDLEVYEQWLARCEDDIFAKLHSDPFNIGSPVQLANALDAANAVDGWDYTDKGNRRTAKPSLMKHINDPDLYALLAYHSSLSTCIGTFMRPWLELSATTGRLHPEWNQVRDSDKKTGVGTKTGRLSSNDPNFQNVPNEFDQPIPEGYPSLPLMRYYCLPDQGHVWIKRDFSSQEVRWLAHFEDGELMSRYQENPRLDPHKTAQDMIQAATNQVYRRKYVKITAFTTIYGGGIPKLAAQMGVSPDEAYEIREGYYTAFPGVRKLQRATTQRGKFGDCIKTWAGRVYYTEPHDKFDFSYKLLNYLIQGSSADQTKKCVCDWDAVRTENEHFLASVHDELNVSVPEDDWQRSMERLQKVMDQDVCDVPMRSEGFVGDNWYELEETE